MLTYLFIGALLLGIGYAVHVLNWNVLLTYHSSTPKEKKSNINTERYRKIMGLYGYITGAIFLVLALMEYLGISVPPTPVTSVFIVWTIFILYFSQKEDGNEA